jgi:hypothetical protein
LAGHRKKPSDTRSSVSPERLQAAITKGVKKSDAKCEGFIGVIVQRQTPKARFDADWSVKGVRFGKADRDKCGLAVQSRGQVEGVDPEAVWLIRPCVADNFIGCEAA